MVHDALHFGRERRQGFDAITVHLLEFSESKSKRDIHNGNLSLMLRLGALNSQGVGQKGRVLGMALYHSELLLQIVAVVQRKGAKDRGLKLDISTHVDDIVPRVGVIEFPRFDWQSYTLLVHCT